MHQSPNRGFELTDNDKNYKIAFSTDAGQRVLEDLKASLGYGQTLYHNKQTTEELHFRMGGLDVLHKILFILSKEQKRD